MLNKTKTTLICIALAFVALGCIFAGVSSRSGSGSDYVYEIFHRNVELDYYGAKNDLVDELDTYIQSVAPGSCLNGLAILEECETEGIDIIFVISQAQKESSFGTKGLGYTTNSVFNVKAYDGKGDKYMDKYSHPDLSIHPYILLLKERYLVDGKTTSDLLVKYTDKFDKRYATDKNYEDSLQRIYTNIVENTQIQVKYEQYNKYKILAGK
jgi:hypothetical protein